MKTCSKCKKHKTLDCFGGNKNMQDGKHHYCKACEHARKALSYLKNPMHHQTRSNAWKKANPNQVKVTKQNWEKNNRGRANALWMKRYALQRNATPAWAELDLIKTVYIKAQQYGFAVDHVIPLQGKNVCGLHVWANLQLLDRSINSSKGNKYYE